MRVFIMRARKARTSPDFDINKLPKQGKLDSVCAAAQNALWLSGDVRRDTIFHAVLEGPQHGPKVVTFTGSGMRGLFHDERSVAQYIKFALQKGLDLGLNEETHVRTGIKVAKKSFERLVWEYAKKNVQMIVLDEKGTDIRKFSFDRDFVCIFGDPIGLPGKVEQFMAQFNASKVSLGPRTLFSSHCPIIVNNETDRKSIA